MQVISQSSEDTAHGKDFANLGWTIRRRPLTALVPMAVALWSWGAATAPAYAAGALPSGGQFVAGSGSISGSATALTINQTTSRGVIDWSHFSIGSGNRVTFDNVQ